MIRRVLVTGGFGYVGGRICAVLASQPAVHITLGSRIARDVPQWVEKGSTTVIDWGCHRSLVEACSGIDTVIHLAAANEVDAARDPAGALETNGVLTVRLVEAAKVAGVRRFIYMSTAHVYGAPLVGDISESTPPLPVHPYATSHRAAEDVVLAARRTGSLEGIVLRLSNSFGAPTHQHVDRWSLLVNDLCRQAVVHNRLTLKTAGHQQRDFITLQDTARCVAHIVALPEDSIGDGLFNVGGDHVCSIYDMAQRIARRCRRVLGFDPPIDRPQLAGNKSEGLLRYSIEKLKGTGFQLTGSIDDEIDATLTFCRRVWRV